MARKESFLEALAQSYSLPFFSKNILQPVFGSNIKIFTSSVPMPVNQSEQGKVKWIKKYGELTITDYKQVDLYEVALNDSVVVERNKVSIGAVVKKLIAGNNAVLASFYYPDQPDKSWRFSFIAKDKKIEEGKIVEDDTNPKRFTYILGPNERCRTAAERFFKLSLYPDFDINKIQDAFSVEKLSKSFFDEYKEHYEAFVKHLSKREIKASVFNGDDKSVRDFAKKLLGRIVFLHFVQKKGWLGASNDKWQDGNQNFMQDLFISSGKKETFYPLWLRTLFYDSLNNPESKEIVFTLPDGKKVKIPYLNGGLFEDDDPKGSSKYLVFPPALFNDLFEFFNQYNFTIYEDSPDDHTIAVDPEMLGHIFENLLEDNKDKGAFYTPKEIVHYMCQESLIQYLATKLDIPENTTFQELGTEQQGMFGNEVKKGQLDILKENKTPTPGITRADVDKFIKQKETTSQIIKNASDINKYLDSVKICDPAIGSGAFPMGLLHEIFNAKQVLKEVANIPELQKIGNAKIKENIIQNSIYGVDIEKGAVDIARLRFWLSLIVDEELPRPLPNLDFKIVVGDSLLPKFDGEVVDIDWEAKYTTSVNEKLYKKMKSDLVELVDSQKKYFSAINDKEKAKLKYQIRELKIEILINQLQLDKTKYSSKNVVNEGFFGGKAKDKLQETEIEKIIIGYSGAINKLEHLKIHLNKPLQFFDWKLDFPEILNSIISKQKNGFDIVIGNPPYITLGGKEEMTLTKSDREYYLKHYKCTEYKLNTFVLFYEKGWGLLNKQGNIVFIVPRTFLDNMYFSNIRTLFQSQSKIVVLIKIDAEIFGEGITGGSAIGCFAKTSNYNAFVRTRVLKDIQSIKDPIYKIIPQKEIFYGENKSFVFEDSNVINLFNKIKLNGEPLEKYFSVNNGANTGNAAKILLSTKNEGKHYRKILEGKDIYKYYIKWGGNWINYDHELKNKIDIKKLDTRQSKIDFALRNPQIFNRSKIIIRQTSDRLIGCIDDDKYISRHSTHCIVSENKNISLKYLLGLFNSKLLNYYYQTLIPEKGKAFAEVKASNIKQLPIAIASKDYRIKIENNVNRLIDIKKKNYEADTRKLETAIDMIVFHIYCLTFAEAKVIDDTLTELEWEKWNP